MGYENRTALDRVIETLTLGINNGTFSQGSALPAQRELAEDFDVSRNVIREAVKVLEGRGMLTSMRGSGIYVLRSEIPVNLAADCGAKNYSMRSILQMCRMIWCTAILYVDVAAHHSELLRLKAQNEKLVCNFTASSFHQKFIYESSFGMNICRMCDNMLAYDFMSEVLKATTDIDYKLIKCVGYRNVLEIDSKIIESLLNGDSTRAFFWGKERDAFIDSLVVNYDGIMDKEYPIYISQQTIS